MVRHRSPSRWQRNRASISTSGVALAVIGLIVQILTGVSPFSVTTTADNTHVKVIASNVDMRPLDQFELHIVKSMPAMDVQVQTTAQQTPDPAVTVESGSNLSKEAAKLGSDWTWQSLCAHTNPALMDCNIVPAGTVIVLNSPIHALPSAPAVAPVAKPAPVKVVETAQVAPAPVVVVHSSTPAPQASTVNGSHAALMAAAGIAPSDYQYVENIIPRESGWCPTIMNGERGCPAFHGVLPHKAYGLPQALPGNKMAAFGADWETNPVTQLRWADWYAHSAYGSWANAWGHWKSNHWW